MKEQLRNKGYAAVVAVLVALTATAGHQWHEERAARKAFKAELTQAGLDRDEARSALATCIAAGSGSALDELGDAVLDILPGFLSRD